MPKVKLPNAYKVEIIESERGWGQHVDETIYFDNEQEARDYCTEYNKRNTSKSVPDYYTMAEYCGKVS